MLIFFQIKKKGFTMIIGISFVFISVWPYIWECSSEEFLDKLILLNNIRLSKQIQTNFVFRVDYLQEILALKWLFIISLYYFDLLHNILCNVPTYFIILCDHKKIKQLLKNNFFLCFY